MAVLSFVDLSQEDAESILVRTWMCLENSELPSPVLCVTKNSGASDHIDLELGFGDKTAADCVARFIRGAHQQAEAEAARQTAAIRKSPPEPDPVAALVKPPAPERHS
jgi:hypothetical protein